jgi:hypothetical protein
VNVGRYQLIPALRIARGNEQLIFSARLGRTGEFAKSISFESSEEGIMVWSFNILGQDKDIRGAFDDGSSDPRGNRSTCGSVIQVPRKESHI